MPTEVIKQEPLISQTLRATSATLRELANLIDLLATASIEDQKDRDWLNSIVQALSEKGENKVYTFKEVCEYLKASRSTLYNLMDSGQLKSFRIGSTYRFTQKELNKFMLSEEEKKK
jgi:excisionase family DNA binding protein